MALEFPPDFPFHRKAKPAQPAPAVEPVQASAKPTPAVGPKPVAVPAPLAKAVTTTPKASAAPVAAKQPMPAAGQSRPLTLSAGPAGLGHRPTPSASAVPSSAARQPRPVTVQTSHVAPRPAAPVAATRAAQANAVPPKVTQVTAAKPSPVAQQPSLIRIAADRPAVQPPTAGPRVRSESRVPAEPPRTPAIPREHTDPQTQAEPAVPAMSRAALPPIPQLTVHPSAAARSPAAERRRAPRMTLVAKATIRPDTPVQMPSLTAQGFVSNISMNGVGFHTRKPLETGGTYRISLELGPLKWACRLRVVSCRHHPESETFDCGGEFIGNELHRQMLLAS